MESRKALVTFLDQEEGHKTLLVPVENLKEILVKNKTLIIEVPSGRKIDIEELDSLEEGTEVLIVPQACGG